MAIKKTAQSSSSWSRHALEIGAAIATIIGTIIAVLAWRLPVQPTSTERATPELVAQNAPAPPVAVVTPTTAPPRASEKPSAELPSNVKVEVHGEKNLGVGVVNDGLIINNR